MRRHRWHHYRWHPACQTQHAAQRCRRREVGTLPCWRWPLRKCAACPQRSQQCSACGCRTAAGPGLMPQTRPGGPAGTVADGHWIAAARQTRQDCILAQFPLLKSSPDPPISSLTMLRRWAGEGTALSPLPASQQQGAVPLTALAATNRPEPGSSNKQPTPAAQGEQQTVAAPHKAPVAADGALGSLATHRPCPGALLQVSECWRHP